MKIPVKITNSAKEYLSIMTEQNHKSYVHLSVSGGGCSGFQYDWNYVDSDKDGTLVDNVINPNAKAQCGCGESFGV